MQEALLDGLDAAPVLQNCSGKHAAMLATAVVNGWPTAGYVAADHPVQRLILDDLARAAGAVQHVGVDGLRRAGAGRDAGRAGAGGASSSPSAGTRCTGR